MLREVFQSLPDFRERSGLRASAYISKDDQPRGILEGTADRIVFLHRAPEGDEDETIPM